MGNKLTNTALVLSFCILGLFGITVLVLGITKPGSCDNKDIKENDYEYQSIHKKSVYREDVVKPTRGTSPPAPTVVDNTKKSVYREDVVKPTRVTSPPVPTVVDDTKRSVYREDVVKGQKQIQVKPTRGKAYHGYGGTPPPAPTPYIELHVWEFMIWIGTTNMVMSCVNIIFLFLISRKSSKIVLTVVNSLFIAHNAIAFLLGGIVLFRSNSDCIDQMSSHVIYSLFSWAALIPIIGYNILILMLSGCGCDCACLRDEE